MSMLKLAFLNFKTSFKNYLSLVISLVFSILVLFNYLNLIFSDSLDSIMDKQNIQAVIAAVVFVLVCFMFFFIWYASNVFLQRRKKDIGIYIFMGLTNSQIGQLYMIETGLIGLVSIALGIGLGMVTSRLFTMILMAISQISVDIHFQLFLEPVLITALLFLAIFGFMMIKGYWNIVHSSILEMVQATRQNEYVHTNKAVLVFKGVLGLLVLAGGCYVGIKDRGVEALGNALIAVVLVTIGIYLFFGGILPLIFQHLVKKKAFLYQKTRNLWVNSFVFRIQKNYRTYAMVCVLLLCSVTVLATSFAMYLRYQGIVNFRNTYTYQITSFQEGEEDLYADLINQDNTVDYQSSLPLLMVDSSYIDTPYKNNLYAFVRYSDVVKISEASGLKLDFDAPDDNEVVELSRLYLMSFADPSENESMTVNHETYQGIASSTVPFLGQYQENMDFTVVNDHVYEKLEEIGTEIYLYNYHIEDPANGQASQDELNTVANESRSFLFVDPTSPDIEWVRLIYSVCIFLFLVFALASGSILFMKIYNDAYEERGRYTILQKMGVAYEQLQSSIKSEQCIAYLLPYGLMSITSYFAIKALSNAMHEDLWLINLGSVLVIGVILWICYLLSVRAYMKNANIAKR